MNPTQHKFSARPLFEHVKSRDVLMRAWLHVKHRVEASKDPTVRAAAAAFASDPQRSVARLQRALRSGTFRFSPQRGVLKRRKSAPSEPAKDPRPIVVAPVHNRIVQRALLDTCQSEDRRIRRHLGALPAVIDCPTSVGGLPGRGVPEAIDLIATAIENGATWYVRSDLKNFFQVIPKPQIKAFLQANVSDEVFVELFMSALSTELSNEEEVRELIRLFPVGEIGVPQGSALSALCANIILSAFDKKLNGRGILTVRYLDDFVILGPNKSAVEKAWLVAVTDLKALGMECHDPAQGTGKGPSINN
jgi:RNA-directed DNA polymerase